MEFLSKHLADIVVILLVLAAVLLAIRSMKKTKAAGGSCSCGCANCKSHCGTNHSH